jgi:dTDP-4-dehydrorhamnose reductase
MDATAPQIIVHCAAYTAVDQAESESEKVHAINAEAVALIATEARRRGALLVHYSSDYVFDGSGETPWREEDPKGPLNVYGRSKLEGELAIQASGCAHLIFRTSWIYGQRGRNFLLTMRQRMRDQRELKIVDDQIGAPTWSRHLAEASALAAAQVLSPARGADKPESWGVYHLCNGGAVTWYGLARAILELDRIDPIPNLIPVPSAEYPTPALRPLNSRLDNSKFHRAFGLVLPDWHDALVDCLEVRRQDPGV